MNGHVDEPLNTVHPVPMVRIGTALRVFGRTPEGAAKSIYADHGFAGPTAYPRLSQLVRLRFILLVTRILEAVRIACWKA